MTPTIKEFHPEVNTSPLQQHHIIPYILHNMRHTRTTVILIHNTSSPCLLLNLNKYDHHYNNNIMEWNVWHNKVYDLQTTKHKYIMVQWQHTWHLKPLPDLVSLTCLHQLVITSLQKTPSTMYIGIIVSCMATTLMIAIQLWCVINLTICATVTQPVKIWWEGFQKGINKNTFPSMGYDWNIGEMHSNTCLNSLYKNKNYLPTNTILVSTTST